MINERIPPRSRGHNMLWLMTQPVADFVSLTDSIQTYILSLFLSGNQQRGAPPMYALAESASQPINTYNNGQPYKPARGRFAPREAVEDQLRRSHAVIDLPREQPSAKRFLQVMVRELKIRCYQPKTIKAYRNRIRNLLRWFGGPPHLITREDVRCYLEVLVDGGAGSSWLSTTLSAIRTLFDKFCYQSITLGLVTPRRAKKLPVVLSREEVIRLLEAAISLRDKLLLGLMYATGVRVSEVVRLRWR
jgi:hypothetical protein